MRKGLGPRESTLPEVTQQVRGPARAPQNKIPIFKSTFHFTEGKTKV